MDYPVESGPPNYRRLFRRSAVWFAALGSAVAFLNQLLLGNGIRVSVLTSTGMPEWLACVGPSLRIGTPPPLQRFSVLSLARSPVCCSRA